MRDREVKKTRVRNIGHEGYSLQLALKMEGATRPGTQAYELRVQLTASTEMGSRSYSCEDQVLPTIWMSFGRKLWKSLQTRTQPR